MPRWVVVASIADLNCVFPASDFENKTTQEIVELLLPDQVRQKLANLLSNLPLKGRGRENAVQMGNRTNNNAPWHDREIGRKGDESEPKTIHPKVAGRKWRNGRRQTKNWFAVTFPFSIRILLTLPFPSEFMYPVPMPAPNDFRWLDGYAKVQFVDSIFNNIIQRMMRIVDRNYDLDSHLALELFHELPKITGCVLSCKSIYEQAAEIDTEWHKQQPQSPLRVFLMEKKSDKITQGPQLPKVFADLQRDFEAFFDSHSHSVKGYHQITWLYEHNEVQMTIKWPRRSAVSISAPCIGAWIIAYVHQNGDTKLQELAKAYNAGIATIRAVSKTLTNSCLNLMLEVDGVVKLNPSLRTDRSKVRLAFVPPDSEGWKALLSRICGPPTETYSTMNISFAKKTNWFTREDILRYMKMELKESFDEQRFVIALDRLLAREFLQHPSNAKELFVFVDQHGDGTH
jgi:acyl carrier protein phosphodiesterase